MEEKTNKEPSMGGIEGAVQQPQCIPAVHHWLDNMFTGKTANPQPSGQGGNPVGPGHRYADSGTYSNLTKNPAPVGEDDHAQEAGPSSSRFGAQDRVYVPTEPANMRKRMLSPEQEEEMGEGANRRKRLLGMVDTPTQQAVSLVGGGVCKDEPKGQNSPEQGDVRDWPQQQQQPLSLETKLQCTGTAEERDYACYHEAGEDCQRPEDARAKRAAAILAGQNALPGPWNGTAMKDLLRRLDAAKTIEMVRGDHGNGLNEAGANQPHVQGLRGGYDKEEFLISVGGSLVCEVCLTEMPLEEREAHIRLDSHRMKVECMKEERDWLEKIYGGGPIVID